MSNAPGPFHTILADGNRPDIVASEGERRQIRMHVGRLIMTWGLVEMFLGTAIEALAAPARHAEFHKITTQMRTAAKINYLKALLPQDWADGGALLNLLATTNSYRNQLAHPVIAMSGFYEGVGAVGWHLSNLDSSKRPEELTPSSMASHELDAEILQGAVGVLSHDEYLGHKTATQMNTHPLSDAILSQPGIWETRQAYATFSDRVRRLFPHT